MPQEGVTTNLSNSPNHFVASLTPQDSELLRPHLRSVELAFPTILYRAEQQIDHVYFPTTGIVSLVVGLSDGRMIECGMVGRNGVVGGGSALDGGIALNQVSVQAPGFCLAIEAALLTRFANESVPLRAALVRYELTNLAQAQQLAACNAAHELEARMSRWLLQVRDLLTTNTLPLTQEFLAHMLGVQRTSVTMVARRLQEAGLIQYRRGHVEIRDTEHLHECSCECYQIINAHYERLIGWRPNIMGLEDPTS